MIKRLILLLLPLGVYGQNCVNEETFTGDLRNKNYNGNICFYSNGGTITNSVNINNWKELSFSGNIEVKQSLNFNGGKVYTSGNTILAYISLGGRDTLFNNGNLIIDNIVSNNSVGDRTNYILTDYSVTVKGVTYYIGDTILTGGGTGNNVVVLGPPVAEKPLSINIMHFGIAHNKITWTVDKYHSIYLMGSNNNHVWDAIEVTNMDNILTEAFLYKYYKLKIVYNDEVYFSDIIRNVVSIDNNTAEPKYYDMMGREITNPSGLYIEQKENSSRILYR